ncbi:MULTISPECIES: prephenate dehydrogenase [Thermodesulfovibrio]|uniref:prephenate dehydrogenase n=2 Tax=Thermodesulfovibrio yellowstonii TaxID=28262 RepID=B5YH67_THEYD|nr:MULTISPECIES: prephenate dehydrogenase [Thermodesulfovibrio]ACI21084.1 prephenate dehydrogenase [Thermodesulfovibrio yellowstonii DSM 11347]GLI52863.1 prephenate dehydrogenase [Thermodesulfovibrio islandicus]
MEDGFNTVSILGVGLIGGSLALALKEKKLVNKIIGYGRNEQRLKEALKLGIIDSYTTSLKKASQAELIVLATPAGIFEKIIIEMLNYLKKGTIIIDVGSVKESVVNSFEKILPAGVFFVGTHPIAGSDKTGFEHAKGDLFKKAKVIITPTENTDKSALEKVSNLWQKIGAVVEFMSADKHDKIYALVSHLPHLISFCMVNTVAEMDKNFIKYAGSGFKDTTRIAKSSPEVWRDIFIMNDKNILQCLEIFAKNLKEIKKMLSKKDSEGVKTFIEKAKNLRKEIDS